MDPQPSTSKHESLSPRKKRRHQSLSVSEKEMILNCYKYVFGKESSESPFYTPRKEDCVSTTAEILGISKRSVYRVIKEHKENITFESPKKSGPRLTFKDKFDEFVFSAIRRKIHQFFYANEAPTLDKVLRAVNDDSDLPSMSRTTMQRVLKHINFKYTTRKRQSCLIDRQDIVLWRKKHLLAMKQYRREGRCIYYQDETWVNEGHTTKKVWTDTQVESSRQAFLDGLTTGLKAPTGKGRRLIISHIGNEEGFVENSALIFESKNNAEDYHQEMNAENFEEWLKGVLPKLKENSVLVLDNAPYHSRKIESIPNSAWRKAAITEWLKEKNIEFHPEMVKAQLLEIVKQNKTGYEKYAVEEFAAQYGVTILRLPLPAIELVWAQVKGHVTRNNKSFKMNEVKKLFEDGLNLVTPQRWANCVEHTKKVEDKMMKLDHLIDDVVDTFIIHVSDSDTTSISSDSEFSFHIT